MILKKNIKLGSSGTKLIFLFFFEVYEKKNIFSQHCENSLNIALTDKGFFLQIPTFKS